MLNRKFAFLLFSLAVLFAVPAQAQYHIYWGDMHGHTAISDGKGSLDDYFTHARDNAKLDFVVVSDHDFGNAAPWKMPQETWTLTQDKVDQYTENGKFVAIAGYEWTSQSKYWTPEEPLFDGPVKFYNHKNVYFPGRVDYLFSSKDPAYNSPNLLAQAVQRVGGLIQNNHLDPRAEGKDQFDYDPIYASVIVNTEMWPDTMQYQGKEYTGNTEKILREFLRNGGKTGFVGSYGYPRRQARRQDSGTGNGIDSSRPSSTHCGTAATTPCSMPGSCWISRSTITSWGRRSRSMAIHGSWPK